MQSGGEVRKRPARALYDRLPSTPAGEAGRRVPESRVLAAGERWAVRANEATVLGSVRSKKHRTRITGHLESDLSIRPELVRDLVRDGSIPGPEFTTSVDSLSLSEAALASLIVPPRRAAAQIVKVARARGEDGCAVVGKSERRRIAPTRAIPVAVRRFDRRRRDGHLPLAPSKRSAQTAESHSVLEEQI